MVGRITGKTVARAGYGLVWIEMAGITTPFTTPVFPFLETVSQRTLDNITPAFTLAASDRGSSRSTAISGPGTCSSGTRPCSVS
jgi:hypothetical protein